MKIIAHRGAKGYLPENTMAAFSKALDLGADGIELDVRVSNDGQLLVFHDESTLRLCNKNAEFADIDFIEIRKLRVAGEHQIPTLSEVLDFIDNRCLVNIELKTSDSLSAVSDLLDFYIGDKNWNPENLLVSSFDWIVLKQLRDRFPDIKIGVLTETDLDLAIGFADSIAAETIHPHFHLLTSENVKQMQQMGFGVFAWTVNEPEDISRIASFGVDGLITDYPSKL